MNEHYPSAPYREPRAMRLTTRLESFRRKRKIKPTTLAREAVVSRQGLTEIRAGRRDPRRYIVARLVSAFRRLTLEPIRADDLFELTNEESGVWRRTNGIVLESRGAANESAKRLIDELRQHDATQWPELIASHAHEPDALARMLILEAKREIDSAPSVAHDLAKLATEIAPFAEDLEPGYRDHLTGCAWLELGNVLRHRGAYDSAIAALQQAEDLLSLRTTSVTELAETWYVVAVIEWKRSNFTHAFRLCRRAERVFDILGDIRRLAHARILEAGIHFEQGSTARARDLWKETIVPLREFKERRSLAAVWMNLGNAEGYLGDTRAACTWLEKAIKEFTRLRVEPEVARALWSLGYITGMHGERGRALLLLRDARRRLQKLHMYADAGFAGLDLAEVLLLDSDGVHEAIDVCRSILSFFERAALDQAKLRAIATLCEAMRIRRARPELVAYVRSYIQNYDQEPEAPFAPPAVPE